MYGVVYENTMPHIKCRTHRQVEEGSVLIKVHLEDFENVKNPITFCNRHTCPRNSVESLGDSLYTSEQQSKYSMVYKDLIPPKCRKQ